MQKPGVNKLEAVAFLPRREHGLEIQKYMLSSPLPWQDTEGPGIRCLMIDINLLGFWGLAAMAGTLGTHGCALSHEGTGG